ncbi:cytochrome P450 alkane hydroxylase [Dendryphion nanum]|uniref:Cytochrome P450 alkane hydroxylase n=1 Tax=Dendryphion nanum TaxID=256645 RepID=A0A9P9DDA0_9PLEO|nr:cytochrome P450 alkane hydroxylase [Dendryphion nanum]
MALITLPKLALTLLALYLARRVHWELTVGIRRRALIKQHGCQHPKQVPCKDPLLNSDLMYDTYKAYRRGDLLGCWARRIQNSGNRTVLLRPLRWWVYLTDDPDNIKTMLATNFDKWSLGEERIAQMVSFLGYGIFCTEGAAWKHSRDTLRPCFERSQVADVDMFERHTKRLIDRIPKDGTTIDLQPLFHLLTLDISTEFLFGQSTNGLDPDREDEGVDEFIEAFEYCENPFENENTKRWGFFGQYLPDSKFKRCAKIMQDFADKYISQQLSPKPLDPSSPSPPQTRYSFLSALHATTPNLVTIRSELLNILLAGRDTTASLLSNILFELPRHPEILSRLRQEIAEHIGTDQPTYEKLKEMKYLRAVMNESQRMYPIVPTNSRQALQDTILPRGGGEDGESPVLITKGSYVAYHSWSLHRRTDIYGPDADVFNPSRWLVNEHPSAPLRPGWGYIPFSGGPRVCIGQNFALTETGYVIVRLLQEFGTIESRDEEPWREKLTLICTGLGGCKVGLRNEG